MMEDLSQHLACHFLDFFLFNENSFFPKKKKISEAYTDDRDPCLDLEELLRRSVFYPDHQLY